jgi:hypothetical protein
LLHNRRRSGLGIIDAATLPQVDSMPHIWNVLNTLLAEVVHLELMILC